MKVVAVMGSKRAWPAARAQRVAWAAGRNGLQIHGGTALRGLRSARPSVMPVILNIL